MKRSYNNGFTLIEVIIYIALFSILIGAVMISVYNIIESENTDNSESELIEEGNFLLDKIKWAMNGVQTISSPSSNASSTMLKVFNISSTTIPIIIQISGNNLTIQNGSGYELGVPEILNNPDYHLYNTVFTHVKQTGNGYANEFIDVAFTLNTKNINGRTVSEKFSETIYLSK